jgi:hypothetical protein
MNTIPNDDYAAAECDAVTVEEQVLLLTPAAILVEIEKHVWVVSDMFCVMDMKSRPTIDTG